MLEPWNSTKACVWVAPSDCLITMPAWVEPIHHLPWSSALINQNHSVFDISFRHCCVLLREMKWFHFLLYCSESLNICSWTHSVQEAGKRMQSTGTLGCIHWHLTSQWLPVSSCPFSNPGKTFTSFGRWEGKLNLSLLKPQTFWLNKSSLWYFTLESEIRKTALFLGTLSYHSY